MSDKFLGQPKARVQKTLDFKMNESLETYSFMTPLHPLNLEREKWRRKLTKIEVNSSFCNRLEKKQILNFLPELVRLYNSL